MNQGLGDPNRRDDSGREGDSAEVKIDRRALRDSLDRLSGLAPESLELDELLTEVIQSVKLVFEIESAGMLVVDDARVLRSITAGDHSGNVLEHAQEQLAEGPCIDSFFYDRRVASADIESDPRWPKFAAAVVPHGIRAVLGTPVRIGGGPIGTLNVCMDSKHEWTESELEAISSYARVLENLLLAGLVAHRNDTLARQLQYALDYRVPIERAVGYLMAVHRTDPVSAFELLRRAARTSQRRVWDLAGEILAGQANL